MPAVDEARAAAAFEHRLALARAQRLHDDPGLIPARRSGGEFRDREQERVSSRQNLRPEHDFPVIDARQLLGCATGEIAPNHTPVPRNLRHENAGRVPVQTHSGNLSAATRNAEPPWTLTRFTARSEAEK